VTRVALDQRHPLLLGSASPRRKELLEQLGLSFALRPSHVDEPDPRGGEAPEAYARALAERKTAAVVERARAEAEAGFVLGADTIVVIDDTILNKPLGDDDGRRMLRLLQGRSHHVITAVSVRGVHEPSGRTIAVRSTVTFRALDERALAAYVASGEGRDKAGSYAIQGLGAAVVRAVEGSYTNVVGLPLAETVDLLLAAGVLGSFP
jgi:septum formation protein